MARRWFHAIAFAVTVTIGCGDATTQIKELTLSRVLRLDGNVEDLVPFDIVVDNGGFLAVGQAADRRVVVFDSAGRRLSVIGRAGSGPGELKNLGSFGWVGDSLWLYGNMRILRFVRDGQFLSTRHLEEPHFDSADSRNAGRLAMTKVVALYGDGKMMVRTAPIARTPVVCTCFVIVSDSMRISRVVATTPTVRMPRNDVETGSTRVSAPFSWGYDMVPSPRGDRVGMVYATADDANSRRWRLTVIDTSGDTTINRTFSTPLERIPEGVIAGALGNLASRLGASGSTIFQLQSLVPEYYQPYAGLLLGRDSTAWIRLRSVPDSSSLWLIVDGTGQVLGQLTLPMNIHPLVVERRRLWAAEADPSGLHHLIVYNIRG